MPRESEIISKIRHRARKSNNVIVGIGDDAAVLRTSDGKDLVACCDLMVEGVHFSRAWAPPKLIGRKALAVTLSDIAAMGAVPRFALISVALPGECSSEYVDEMFEGILEMADSRGVSVVGGDTSSSPDSLFIDTSVIGECERGRAVTRSGARVGDMIYVSGSLGASALGLKLLEGGFRLDVSKEASDPAQQQALLKHLAPDAQLKLGRAIGEARLATAMIDISDGLSTDLSHILAESDCGAIIRADAIPIAQCLFSLASVSDHLQLAVNGGEEYELLFTAGPDRQQQLAELAEALDVSLSAIGQIVEKKGLQLERNSVLESLDPCGYEHLI
jgi:thiamine-monophosphate kinase